MFQDDTRVIVSHGREIKAKEIKTYLDMVVQTKKLVLNAILEGKSPEEAKKSKVLKGWEKWNSLIFPTTLTSNTWIDNLYSTLNEGKELSAFYVLKKTYLELGLEAMKSKYKEIWALKKREQYIIENDLNIWGYGLLSEQKFTDAIEVFKINTETFPNSANAYDSLAEAYMIAGNKELAIKNYEKSLELNPQNTNAVEQLKKLRSK